MHSSSVAGRPHAKAKSAARMTTNLASGVDFMSRDRRDFWSPGWKLGCFLDAWVALATIFDVKKSRKPPPAGPTQGAEEAQTLASEAKDAADCLLKALGTKSAEEKRRFADQGLRLINGGPGIGGEPAGDEEDYEMMALLLRQKYLAEIEEGNDRAALRVAEQMVELGTLGDVARQDAARAALGVDDLDAAIGHLRIAARVCPPDRRAFHYAHLGTLLRFDGQVDQAIEAFKKAIRWATEDRDLYLAQQALAEVALGRTTADLEGLRERLESDDPMKAYSLWVLGELCLVLGDTESGATYLKRFLSRQTDAPRAKALALKGEVAHASALLRQISA